MSGMMMNTKGIKPAFEFIKVPPWYLRMRSILDPEKQNKKQTKKKQKKNNPKTEQGTDTESKTEPPPPPKKKIKPICQIRSKICLLKFLLSTGTIWRKIIWNITQRIT